jgi:hypothetical protein
MCTETLTTKEDVVSVAILSMFKESFLNTHLTGRFSPHKNFTESLQEWCEVNGKNFKDWNFSMYRLFTLHSRFPSAPLAKIVNFVLARDKEFLNL